MGKPPAEVLAAFLSRLFQGIRPDAALVEARSFQGVVPASTVVLDYEEYQELRTAMKEALTR